MRSLAEERGMHSLVAPVRPTLKSSYPLTPFERYVEWRREDGTPFDPWLRVHYRLGAELLKPMPRSLIVTGKISEWEEWTGRSFPARYNPYAWIWNGTKVATKTRTSGCGILPVWAARDAGKNRGQPSIQKERRRHGRRRERNPGFSNTRYNLVSVLYHALEGGATYD